MDGAMCGRRMVADGASEDVYIDFFYPLYLRLPAAGDPIELSPQRVSIRLEHNHTVQPQLTHLPPCHTLPRPHSLPPSLRHVGRRPHHRH